VLGRHPFGVKVYEHPGACAGHIRQAFFVRRDSAGRVRTAVHPADWDMVVDPILLTDLLKRLGIEAADYANAINEDDLEVG